MPENHQTQYRGFYTYQSVPIIISKDKNKRKMVLSYSSVVQKENNLFTEESRISYLFMELRNLIRLSCDQWMKYIFKLRLIIIYF